MDARYRIVFKGQIHEGYDLALVKKLVAFRLNASATQIERLFTGRKVIVKADLSERIANRYVGELSKLGMVAWAEPERKKTPPKQAPQPPAATEPEFDPLITCVNALQTRHQNSALPCEESTTAQHDDFDPQKTTLNLGAAEALLNQMGLSLSANHQVVEMDTQTAHVENPPVFNSTPPSPPIPVEAPAQVSTDTPPAEQAAPIAAPASDAQVHCPHCGTNISQLMVERDCQPAQNLHVFPLTAAQDEETIKAPAHSTPLQSAWRWLRARSRSGIPSKLS
ncbi:hypothetical protein [Uliginosibacterium gangwonense]|uniref:hypothetical protein n=1 Tax=Uliginosibacterium gangwonense TaxID=392736 RepID=UPI00035C322C|nr:hypothetical protein [Uliginosibacterium gangwonense]